MRYSLGLFMVMVSAGAVGAACGSGSGASTFDEVPDGAAPGTDGGGDGPAIGFGDTDGSATGDATSGSVQNLASMRIEPADATLAVAAGKTGTQAYRVLGVMKGATAEVDITSRVAFYVPDNYLVGGFPASGGPAFTTRLPVGATDPPQRGGKLTVQAQAQNSDGTITTATTSLTVTLSATLSSPNATPALPANPSTKFTGTAVAARAPALVYPNDGVMLPPNLRRLEVHWQAGAAQNQLFEITFVSSLASITYYSRCGALGSTYKASACGFELDETGYRYLAESNRGAADVKLKIRATDDAGTAFGESATFHVTFAESNVEGGIYYWTVTNPPRIMRYDFGGTAAAPEEFLKPGVNGVTNTCVGCHTLSRDGTKLVSSVGGQNDGRIVYLNDLTKAAGASGWLTLDGASTAARTNRIQFASFAPDGKKFVAVYGDDASSGGDPKPTDLDAHKLWFHDGTTGLRSSSITLPWKPDHPDWSPDGTKIAVTRVGNEGTTTQRPRHGGIELLAASGATFGAPTTLIPILQGMNRYNPNFVPDSSFLLYSESTCPGGNWDSGDCDADADPSAKTWAVQPKAGATPVLLTAASKGGVADGASTDLADTFPRNTPFQSKQGSGKLFWFTVASRREPGLRARASTQQLLWMFAVDPAKVLAGKDGSYPGFFLPFQDLQTSNHIGQWTERIVSGNPPAPPPPPPPPPAPPPPPPPPR